MGKHPVVGIFGGWLVGLFCRGSCAAWMRGGEQMGGQNMEEKETFRDAVLRGFTWAAIFTALALFWGGVVAAMVAWFR